MKQPTDKTMENKSYRFYWFARISWSFMKGHRYDYFRHFLSSWRRFNRMFKGNT